MPDAPARDAVVLRFPPGGPEDVKRIRKEARWTHRKHQVEGQPEEPWYRLSLWVDSAREGESRHELTLRLVRSAGLNGINLSDMRNVHFWWSTAGDLYDRGSCSRRTATRTNLKSTGRWTSERNPRALTW